MGPGRAPRNLHGALDVMAFKNSVQKFVGI